MKNSRVPIVKSWFAAHYPAWRKHRMKGKVIEKWKEREKSIEEKKTPVISAETMQKNKVIKNPKVISSKYLVMSPRGGSKPRW
jgi:hypothetical protein